MKLVIATKKGDIIMFKLMDDIIEAAWINTEINPYNYSERIKSSLFINNDDGEFVAGTLILRAKDHIFKMCKFPDVNMTSDDMTTYANRCMHASKFLKKIEEFASFIVSYEWK